MSVAAVVIWGGPWPLHVSGSGGGSPEGLAKFGVQPHGSSWAGIGSPCTWGLLG